LPATFDREVSSAARSPSLDTLIGDPMHQPLSSSARTAPAGSTGTVIALFDLEGRLLRGSDCYSALLQSRALADDLLALPRSLALRAACGYPASPAPLLMPRAIFLRGAECTLRGVFVAAGGSASAWAVALTLTRTSGESPPAATSAEGQTGPALPRRPALRRRPLLPLRRLHPPPLHN
jgi:hypothetical protein